MLSSWKKYILGCAVGNFLEWYDFILYGFFAPVFSQLFFPMDNKFISLLLTFAVFASACIVRPFSGALFGYIGDKYGRRKALVYSIALITVATVSMGLLPSYQSVGVLAPILLILCRLIQGVAVSGEEIGAAILLAENAPKQQQTLMGSIILSSVYAGLFIGALVALVVFLFSSENFLVAWGWRIPFLSSVILGVVGLKMRLSAFDSREFMQLKNTNALLKNPIKILFKTYLRPFVLSIAVSAVLAVAIYTFAVYLPSYYTSLAGFGEIPSLVISVIFLFCIACLVPIIGWWGDKAGAIKLMLVGCVGLFIFSYPVFWLLAQKILWMAVLAEFILMIFLAFIAACTLSIVINMFPVNIRYTGACISFNLSMTVFGSTAPMITLTLQSLFHNPIAPCLYLSGAALISIIALVLYGGSPIFLRKVVVTAAEGRV